MPFTPWEYMKNLLLASHGVVRCDGGEVSPEPKSEPETDNVFVVTNLVPTGYAYCIIIEHLRYMILSRDEYSNTQKIDELLAKIQKPGMKPQSWKVRFDDELAYKLLYESAWTYGVDKGSE